MICFTTFDEGLHEGRQSSHSRACPIHQRKDIWTSAHYSTRTEFERWQRNDPKATRAANERFVQLLQEKRHLK